MMIRTAFLAGFAGAALVFAAPAQAQSGASPRHPFEQLDVDRDGSLSKREVLAKLPGLTAGFDFADSNGDLALDRMEYQEAMGLSANMYGEDGRSAHKRDIFRSLDLDGDRAVSKEEARWRPEIAANFAAADRDGDGRLGVSEFGLISLFTLATRGGNQSAPDKLDLAGLYREGISAREVIDTPVRAASGERIGDVKDIIVDRNGHISRLVVEVGGFFELGDQHIGVPWKDITFGEDMRFVQVPLREVENGTYSLFGSVPQGEDVPAALTSWRVNELIGDYASLADVPRYGIVTDVIFDNRGRTQAVVVDRAGDSGGFGLYAYPYTGFAPASYAHALPYGRETVVALEPFDYAELGRQSRYAGTQAAAAGASAEARR
ncbi:MAG TPA: PRC-barrel domain-containing protein [Burkholderiales bacterium]